MVRLAEWKRLHEAVIRRIVGLDLEAAIAELRSSKRYVTESRELLAFLDSKRVFYEGLDSEFPPRVLDSLMLIRERVASVRAKVATDSQLFAVLGGLQEVIRHFLKEIGPDTNLERLQCDSRNPTWVKFANELIKLRQEFTVLLRPIAASAGHPLAWLGSSDIDSD
jgi:hypothetical protein